MAHRRIDDTERKEAAAKAAKRVATADAQAQIKRARTEPARIVGPSNLH